MRMRGARHLLSNLLLAAGLVLFFLGAREVIESHWGQSQVAHDFGSQAPSPVQPVKMIPRILPGSPVAKLSIPRLDTQLFVVEGSDDSDLRRGPGHMTGTAMPGAAGNCVIAGHRDTHFRVLKDIHKGDVIALNNGRDNFRYRVSSTSIVSPDDVTALHQGSEAKLHLITCYPFYYVGPAPKRFVVEADLVEQALPAAHLESSIPPVKPPVKRAVVQHRRKPVSPTPAALQLQASQPSDPPHRHRKLGGWNRVLKIFTGSGSSRHTSSQ